MQLTAEPIQFEPPVTGNGRIFRLDAPTILGDPGAEATQLGQIHRLDNQAVGGAGAGTKSNTVKRLFTYTSESGDTVPENVFVSGQLDGLLQGDNGGQASVLSMISISDASGNLLGTDTFSTSADSLVGQNNVVDVDEVLGFSAMLMPGEIYELSSTLTTTTSLLGPGSAARALFTKSFLVELGNRPVPEPTTIVLLGMAAMVIGGKRVAGFPSLR